MSLTRRVFLELAALGVPLAGTATGGPSQAPVSAADRLADMVVTGSGLGGCAAGLAACRAGLRVVCTEASPTGSADKSPAGRPARRAPVWIESFGCTRSYREFRDGVRAYFIDATELGDLLPLTTTEFVIGAESHEDTGELPDDLLEAVRRQVMALIHDHVAVVRDAVVDDALSGRLWMIATSSRPVDRFTPPPIRPIDFGSMPRKAERRSTH